MRCNIGHVVITSLHCAYIAVSASDKFRSGSKVSEEEAPLLNEFDESIFSRLYLKFFVSVRRFCVFTMNRSGISRLETRSTRSNKEELVKRVMLTVERVRKW